MNSELLSLFKENDDVLDWEGVPAHLQDAIHEAVLSGYVQSSDGCYFLIKEPDSPKG